MNLNQTLSIILSLIDRDVKVIQQIGEGIQLDHQSASTLCKYATTLSNMKEVAEKDSVKEKKELNKLSTEELIQEFLKAKPE